MWSTSVHGHQPLAKFTVIRLKTLKILDFLTSLLVFFLDAAMVNDPETTNCKKYVRQQ